MTRRNFASDLESFYTDPSAEQHVTERYIKSFPRFPTIDIVRDKLRASVAKLYHDDWILMASNVSEQTISGRLAIYLSREFPKFDVDCEYNRHFDASKGIDMDIHDLEVTNKAREILRKSQQDNPTALLSEEIIRKIMRQLVNPDILIHNRRNNGSNLIVIEVKKDNNYGRDEYELDQTKLFALTKPKSQEGKYRYPYGFFLELGKSLCRVREYIVEENIKSPTARRYEESNS